MKLKAYNKYWNRWDEVYDFPFLRRPYEAIHVKTKNGWEHIQIANYCCFEREKVNNDSFKKILEDIQYLVACCLTLVNYLIIMKIYHPIKRNRDRLIGGGS